MTKLCSLPPFLLPRLSMFNGETSSGLQYATKSLALYCKVHCGESLFFFFETFSGYVQCQMTPFDRALASYYITPYSAQLGSKIGTFMHESIPAKEGSTVGWLRAWTKSLGLSRSKSGKQFFEGQKMLKRSTFLRCSYTIYNLHILPIVYAFIFNPDIDPHILGKRYVKPTEPNQLALMSLHCFECR